MSTRASLAEICRAATLVPEPGAVAELRALHTSRGTMSGYFDEPEKLAQAGARLSGGAPGVYVTLNPVRRDLLARANNHVVDYARTTTGDIDVERRRWLLVDCDAVRPSGISSTDDEHAAALSRATACRDYLRDELGVPADALVLADSGNGGHVLVRVDLANDDASRQLVDRCLYAFAFMLDDNTVTVDVAVGNAGRIVKLYGTLAAKGDDMPDRPHRLARILEAPDVLAVAPRELLEQLAARAPKTEERGTRRAPAGGDFNIDDWIARSGLTIKRSGAWQGGRRWILNPCPWDVVHANSAAYIVQHASGAIAAGCHHSGCVGKDWHALRDVVESAWRERRASTRPRAADAEERGDARTGKDDDGADSAEPSEPWPDPLPLDARTVPPFPVEALPPALADMVRDVARVTQVPADLPALAGLGVIAAATARRALVAIGDSHTEPLNLYVAPVAESGERKGPMLRAMLAPVYEVQREQQHAARPEVAAAAERRHVAEKRLEVLRGQAAKATDPDKRKRVTDEAATLARELPPLFALPKLWVSDRTPEKLECDLAEQGGALLIADEEAGTLFAIAGGRYARDGSAQLDLYLKGYDGGEIDTDRMTRGPVTVEAPALSINVTPQPFLLAQLRDRPEFHHRGLLPRFVFAVPASLVGERQYDASAAPNAAIRAAYRDTIRRLLDIRRPGAIAEVPRLRIEGAARDVWAADQDRIEGELREGGQLRAIREWANKQPGRVARIAAALHLVVTVGAGRPWSEVIEARTVEAACRVGEYLEAHALAAYDVMAADPLVEGARRVLAWVRRTQTACFTEREAFRAVGQVRGGDMESFRRGLALLVDAGHLRASVRERSGRPGRPTSPTYRVHPATLARQKGQNPFPPLARGNSVDSVRPSGASDTVTDARGEL